MSKILVGGILQARNYTMLKVVGLPNKPGGCDGIFKHTRLRFVHEMDLKAFIACGRLIEWHIFEVTSLRTRV